MWGALEAFFMARSYRRLAILGLLLLIATLLAPGVPARGQAEEIRPVVELIDLQGAALAAGAAMVKLHAVQPAAAAQASSVFLPLIRKSPGVSQVQFASQLDANGNLIDPRASFGYGFSILYSSTTIEGGQGSTYLLRWHFPDGKRLDSSGTIMSSPRSLVTGICFTRVGSCSEPAEPVRRGTYTLQVYLNGELREQGSAVVQ
jgi:hypothetical protein